ncbi:tyrosine-type recombinase/integrase [Achromobacter ruhlandii]|nr:integrase [Achromobacter ruhlandii]AKP92226.1 hypothetical protein Axylo_4773 [Achromobacter xylosoxidans]MCZ8434096.1 integrase [Achromobacter ruhlandii]MDC6152863.1 integrase [Achromobacter ruhlandii]MDD7980593.1 integrase [Achromobacter ruhlandii]
MKKQMTLKTAIETIKPRQFLRIESVSPRGSLEIRKAAKDGITFYYRFTHDGKPDRVQIGLYDKLAPPKSVNPTKQGYSLSAARFAAAALAARHYEARDEGGLRGLLQQAKAEVEAKQEAEALAAVAKGYTLEKLMTVYADGLRNPATAKDTRNSVQKNVKVAFPKIAATQANQVTTEQISTVLRKILEAGHKTTARQVRAYLHAAYEQARKINNDPAASKRYAPFNVKINPVSDVSSIPNSYGVDKNPLMPEVMREYWKVINVPGRESAFLRLHLLLGGQRLEQLLRLKSEDVRPNAVVLEDTKGRSGNVRLILIPLIEAAETALNELRYTEGEFAFSINPGTPLSATTLRRWAKNVVGDSIEGFSLKRVRSGVTTLLAKLKVPKEFRDELQSHGLSSVEKRHYNLYEYFDEKKEALQAMYDFLNASGEEKERERRPRERRARTKSLTGLGAWRKQRR